MTSKFVLNKNEIEALCIAGSYAPSGGNAQPWHVDVRGDLFLISLDPTRSENPLDVNCTASIFSIGSFAENVIIAARGLGLIFEVNPINAKNNNGFKVEFKFKGRQKKQNEILNNFIEKRVTNRQLYDGKIISDEVIDNLRKLTESSICELSIVKNVSDKKKIVDVLGIADGLRFTNEKMRDYMFDEMRWTNSEVNQTKDGLDVKTLEMPGNLIKMMKMMSKVPSMVKLIPKKAFENQTKPLLMGCSHLCCLSFKKPLTQGNLFESGRIMERIWLEATRFNLALHPWTVLPFFIMRANDSEDKIFSSNEKQIVKSLDIELHKSYKIPNDNIAVFIFRLSYAKKPTARSIRLPWTSFATVN